MRKQSMCGFIGAFDLERGSAVKDPTKRKRILESLASINHRGPDSLSYWVDERMGVAFGHARLSIIDLDGGQQPISSQDGNIVAVVNGEFYDYERIRKELQLLGHTFKTNSDSEILIALYREYGTNCLKSLRGEFAFLLFDKRQNQLFAGRDRFGIKPIYYSIHENTIYFASEIKALFAAGIPAAWDKFSYLTRSFYLGENSLYQNIKSIEPGHFMICTRQAPRTHRYWDFNYPIHDVSHEEQNEGQVIEQVRELILESIKLRLRADVPVAFYLSGGLDSSAVLAIAAQYLGKNLPAFTIAFVDDQAFNESAFAKTMADHVSADFREVPVTNRMLADNFDHAIWHNESPFFNAHGIGKYLLSDAVHKAGYRVALTGEGADEIFAGYPHFRRDQNSAAGISQHVRLNAKYTDGIEKPSWLKKVVGTDVSWIENQHGMVSRIRPMISTTLLQESGSIDPFRLFIDQIEVDAQVSGRDPVHVAMYLWAKSFLPNFVLTTLGDRMEMAHSIEGRVPFLDHKLVEQVVRLPASLKIRGKTEKYILREAIKPYLPVNLYERKKHYFRAPLAISQKGNPLWQKVEDMLRSDTLKSVPFFDAQAVRKHLDNLPKLSEDERNLMDPLFMELASICVLQEKFAPGN